jgi:hypothetical protein
VIITSLLVGASMVLADSRHWLDNLAVFKVGHGLVDGAEVIELHQPVQGKGPGPVQLDQFENKVLRYGFTLNDSQGLVSVRQTILAALAGSGIYLL